MSASNGRSEALRMMLSLEKSGRRPHERPQDHLTQIGRAVLSYGAKAIVGVEDIAARLLSVAGLLPPAAEYFAVSTIDEAVQYAAIVVAVTVVVDAGNADVTRADIHLEPDRFWVIAGELLEALKEGSESDVELRD
jgi:hypothetical protein